METSKFMEEGIRDRIASDLKPFRYGMKEFQNMDNLARGHPHYKGELLRMQVKDGRILCDNLRDTSSRLKDRPWIAPRKAVIFKMFRDMALFMSKIDKKLPDMLFYVLASDTYAYDFQTLPMMCIVKPANRNGILIPDDTFEAHPPCAKEQYNWDEVRAATKRSCENVEKLDTMFFKGSNTTQGRGGIRGYLAEEPSSKELPLKIEVPSEGRGILTKFEHIWEFCKYKYLLNLPGGQPWSYRKKFLFLLKSLVIDVVLIQEFEKGNPNDSWINFFDNLFVPNVDYVEFRYTWTPTKNKMIDSSDLQQLKDDLKKVYDEFSKDPEHYKKMVESAHRKANSISMELVYRSMYSILIHFHEKVCRDNGPTSHEQLRQARHGKHPTSHKNKP